MAEAKDAIMKVYQSVQCGCLATVNADGKPWCRYVMMFGQEDMSVWSSTFKGSRKYEAIMKNPKIHLTLGYDGVEFDKAEGYIQFDGKCELSEDVEDKKKYWKDFLAQFFKGADDPNYVVMKFIPEKIEFLKVGQKDKLEWKPE